MNSRARAWTDNCGLSASIFTKRYPTFITRDFAVVTLPDVAEGSKGLKKKRHGSFAAYAKF